MDLVRRLRGALEPPVDLDVELGEPAVHRLGHSQEMTVDLGVSVRQLRAPLGPQLPEHARKPDEAADEGSSDEQDEENVRHGLTDGRETVGRRRGGAAGVSRPAAS
jgi:hypothetical protein